MATMLDLADRLVAGRLQELLTGWRDAGESYDSIAVRLAGLGVEVTGETVRRWCATLGVEQAS